MFLKCKFIKIRFRNHILSFFCVTLATKKRLLNICMPLSFFNYDYHLATYIAQSSVIHKVDSWMIAMMNYWNLYCDGPHERLSQTAQTYPEAFFLFRYLPRSQGTCLGIVFKSSSSSSSFVSTHSSIGQPEYRLW